MSQDIIDPVDLDFLRNITDCDIEFEQDLLKTFIESSGNDIRRMEESIGNAHNNDWYLSSHSLRAHQLQLEHFH